MAVMTMFYKTENGAHVADVYMSLIYTCELCRANPFDYLTELQRHAPEVAANPACWMPWNYRDTHLSSSLSPMNPKTIRARTGVLTFLPQENVKRFSPLERAGTLPTSFILLTSWPV